MSTRYRNEIKTRRVYNHSDKLIKALLGAGLEYLITNGYHVEKYVVNSRSTINTEIENYQNLMQKKKVQVQDIPEDSSTLAKIMEELYQLEAEYKRNSQLQN